MGEVPPLTARQVERVLSAIGFTFDRQKGSHRVWIRAQATIVVPDHPGDLKKGTLHSIIRATGLSPEEFLAHL